MDGVTVDAGSALAHTIQAAVQPKLIENGWVAEENDTTLSEYVTMMIVNGKDLASVISEVGGDLLGVGEDDPAVAAFAEWLFEQVRELTAAPPTQPAVEGVTEVPQSQDAEQTTQPIPSVQDSAMDDAAPTERAPSGPKAMRNGNAANMRGRGGRMLGQINNHLNRDREQQLPDSLRRIKGAAAGFTGRVNTHGAGRGAPRGPRGSNAPSGFQRMANGAGRGGPNASGLMGQINPMMQPGNMPLPMGDAQSQMAFMQMMEAQTSMLAQIIASNGQQQQRGGFTGQNRGRPRSLLERSSARQNGQSKGQQQNQNPESSPNGDGGSGMDVDSKGSPFDTKCHFDTKCTNPNCPYAHQSPAAPAGQTMDMTDTCAFGAACQNTKCVGRHPSPAQRNQHNKQEVDCKYYPNCANPNCPFRHPEMPPCRNGADCNVSGCKFTHSKIMCRYTPCTKPFCPFKHVEGQKGVFKDKVWTAGSEGGLKEDGGGGGGGGGAGTSDRFAELKANEGQEEELIIPGQQSSEGVDGSSSQMQEETQIVT